MIKIPAFSTDFKSTMYLDSTQGLDLVSKCVKWPRHRKDHLITRDMLMILKKD